MEKITSKKKLILYGCSGLGVNLLNIIVGSYLCSALIAGGFDEHLSEWTYLGKDLVVAGLWSIFVFVAKALDGIIDLPFSSLADRMHTKLGRRKTAILMGFVPMIVSYLLFLIPLNKEASILNTVWFGVLLCLFYASYTLTMLTYYATFSEVCKDEKDTVVLSNTKSILDVVYFALGFSLLPVFVSLGLNIRIIALLFLPLSLTMMIPMFLLKEKARKKQKEQADGENAEQTEVAPSTQGKEEEVIFEPEREPLTLGKALKCSFGSKPYMLWLFTASFVLAMGLQLFLGGINEVFSTTGLNMTYVMVAAFAPVPLTLILYNKVVKKYGLAIAFRYSLIIFALGMGVMFLCCMIHTHLAEWQLTLIAVLGALFVSFGLGSFFSINYTVPTSLARTELQTNGKDVASMYFAAQGLFEGVAAGIATGVILVQLKAHNVIWLLPVIASCLALIAFGMSFALPKQVRHIGKQTAASTEPAPAKEQAPVQE